MKRVWCLLLALSCWVGCGAVTSHAQDGPAQDGPATPAPATPGTSPAPEGTPGIRWVYFGTYTQRASRGIYLSRLNLETGALTAPELVAETVNPSFLALHPSRRFLYAVNEVDNWGGEATGAVSAFAIDPATGQLSLLNQVAVGGTAPCHLQVDATGRHVLVANYGTGSVAVLPIEADGRVGDRTCLVQHTGSSVDKSRQEGPHAHCINLDAANRFAFAADLGLDKVLIYAFDAEAGLLKPALQPVADVAPGSGPRHMAIHPNQKHAYVINEMASTVTVFDLEAATGGLRARQTLSTLPAGYQGSTSTAEIMITPDGKYLYGSNRGHDSLAAFAIAPETGELTHIDNFSTQGKTPRGFGVDPDGHWIVAGNQDSDTVVVFQIDPATGRLQSVGEPLAVPMPVSVIFR